MPRRKCPIEGCDSFVRTTCLCLCSDGECEKGHKWHWYRRNSRCKWVLHTGESDHEIHGGNPSQCCAMGRNITRKYEGKRH